MSDRGIYLQLELFVDGLYFRPSALSRASPEHRAVLSLCAEADMTRCPASAVSCCLACFEGGFEVLSKNQNGGCYRNVCVK